MVGALPRITGVLKFVPPIRNWAGPARAPVAALTVAAQVTVGP